VRLILAGMTALGPFSHIAPDRGLRGLRKQGNTEQEQTHKQRACGAYGGARAKEQSRGHEEQRRAFSLPVAPACAV